MGGARVLCVRVTSRLLIMSFGSSVFSLTFCLGTVFTFLFSLALWQQVGGGNILLPTLPNAGSGPHGRDQAGEAQGSWTLSWVGGRGFPAQKEPPSGPRHSTAIPLPLPAGPVPSSCPRLSPQSHCSASGSIFTYCALLKPQKRRVTPSSLLSLSIYTYIDRRKMFVYLM